MPKMRALNPQKPSDCKAGARKSRPPWGIQKSMCKNQKPSPLGEGGRREPDGRGELAYKYRLRPNQRTYPNHHRATNPHYPRKAIQLRKRAPPHRALTGPPPTQRGRLNYSPQSMCKTQKPSPLGEGEPRQRWKGGTRLQI